MLLSGQYHLEQWYGPVNIISAVNLNDVHKGYDESL